ncbi:hypothetical protein EAN99_27700 [Klebsiella pneumoniae]|nr:hypothetical protein EAN99_27700 [Klebsiella pneumoniae]
MVKGINVKAPTPLWMKEKLRRCGIRSIDAVVDVTNYVLLELGQPMHAFDRDRIEGGIVVRMAKEGETSSSCSMALKQSSTATRWSLQTITKRWRWGSSAGNTPALTTKPKTCCWNARSSARCPLPRAVMARSPMLSPL